jgi:hypothetical protein
VKGNIERKRRLLGGGPAIYYRLEVLLHQKLLVFWYWRIYFCHKSTLIFLKMQKLIESIKKFGEKLRETKFGKMISDLLLFLLEWLSFIIKPLLLSIIISLIFSVSSCDLAEKLNLIAKSENQCHYSSNDELVIKTTNNKSINLTANINANNNCEAINSKQASKKDLTKLQDYIAIFATFLVAIVIFIIENQRHLLKLESVKVVMGSFVLPMFFSATLTSLILFFLSFYWGNNFFISNAIIVFFPIWFLSQLMFLNGYDNLSQDEIGFINRYLITAKSLPNVWNELIRNEVIDKFYDKQIQSLLKNSLIQHYDMLEKKSHLYTQINTESLLYDMRSFLANDKVINATINNSEVFAVVMKAYNEKEWLKKGYEQMLEKIFCNDGQKYFWAFSREFYDWFSKENDKQENSKLEDFKLEVMEFYYDKFLLNFDSLKSHDLFFIKLLPADIIKDNLSSKIDIFSPVFNSLRKTLWQDIDSNEDDDKINDKIIKKLEFFCQDNPNQMPSESLFLMLKILIYSFNLPILLNVGGKYYDLARGDKEKYDKFFAIFYQIFKKYNFNNNINNFGFFGDLTKEEIDKGIENEKTEKTNNKKSIFSKIINSKSLNKDRQIDILLKNLITLSIVRDILQWQIKCAEKNIDYKDYKIAEEELNKYIENKPNNKYIYDIFKTIYLLELSYKGIEKSDQRVFIESFTTYCDEIFEYCQEYCNNNENNQEMMKQVNKIKNLINEKEELTAIMSGLIASVNEKQENSNENE